MTSKPVTLEEWQAKGTELVRLLIECRDALPAINLAQARLHGVRLDLADRIEAALKPWEVHDVREDSAGEVQDQRTVGPGGRQEDSRAGDQPPAANS